MTAIYWNTVVVDQAVVASNQRRPELAPGSAAWFRNDAGVPKRLYYICPCGCGLTKLTLLTKGSPANGLWHWNGDEERPTFEPSIQHVPGPESPCSWHGNLIDGEWRTAP